MLPYHVYIATCLAYEVVSGRDGLPDGEDALDLVAVLLVPWGQQVPPHTQVRLHSLLDVLDQSVDLHSGP